jgi:hypothetical protein
VWVLRRIRSLAAGGVLLAGLGALAVVLVSLSSNVRAEAPASPDAPRRLCGLDGGCDTEIRVEDVWRAPWAGTAPDRVPADGVFYVVTAEIRSLGETREAPAVRAEVRDADGRTYGRAWDIEARLPPPPAGRVRWVFDLPDWISAPRVVLHREGLLHRLVRPVDIPLPAPEP